MTGLSLMHGDLSGKRVALLKEAVPGLKRVAFVIDPSDPNSHQIGGARTTVEALGLSSGQVRVSGPEAVEDVFAAIAKDGYDGAMIGGSMFFNERKRVGAAALANKVPTISLSSGRRRCARRGQGSPIQRGIEQRACVRVQLPFSRPVRLRRRPQPRWRGKACEQHRQNAGQEYAVKCPCATDGSDRRAKAADLVQIENIGAD
jgi:hypothetical protein